MADSVSRHSIKKIARIILFLIITFVIYVFVTFTLRNKDDGNLSRMPVSYRDKCDVILLGSSIIMDGIYPMQLYHEQGIAAYNLGCGDQSMAESYYILKHMMTQADIKMVVLDVFYVYRDHYYANEGRLHYVTDKLPFWDKVLCVFSTVPAGDRLNFIYELGAYHDRWENLIDNDFQDWTERDRRVTYGARTHYRKGPMKPDKIDDKAVSELPEKEERYLRLIIEECQNNGIDIMLMLAPTQYTGTVLDEQRENNHGMWNKVSLIADEYGINYLNFMYHIDELNLDYNNDTEYGVHLNAYGAKKLTEYVGKYLRKNYCLPDVRNNPDYEFMDRDYDRFVEYCKRLEAEAVD